MWEALWQKVRELIICSGTWMFDKTDAALQWIGKWASPLFHWFINEDFYVLMLLGGTIVTVGIAVLMLYKIPWTTKKEDKKMDHGDYKELYSASWNFGLRLISMAEYILGLTWMVAIGSAQECKGFNGMIDMYMAQENQLSFYNFHLWFDPLKYLTIFLLLRFAFSVVGGIIRLEFLRLLRFLVLTLACIFAGMTGGFILTFLNELSASGFIGTIITVPIFFLVYTIPVVWIYTPPAIVGGLILLIIISPFVGLFTFFFGEGGSSAVSGSGGDSLNIKITTVYTEVFSGTGKLLYTTFDFFTHI